MSMDLCFLLDATGSMDVGSTGEIGVKALIKSIKEIMKSLIKNF